MSTLTLAKNSGKAEAVRQGVLEALKDKVDYIGFWDADLATPLFEINNFITLLNEKDIDMVSGLRLARLGAKIKRRLLRHYLGRIFATVVSTLLGVEVYDTQCGAKIFRKSLAEEIFQEAFCTRWLFDVELFKRIIALKGKTESSKKLYEYPLYCWQELGVSKISLLDCLKVPFEIIKIFLKWQKRVNYMLKTKTFKLLSVIIIFFVYALSLSLGIYRSFYRIRQIIIVRPIIHLNEGSSIYFLQSLLISCALIAIAVLADRLALFKNSNGSYKEKIIALSPLLLFWLEAIFPVSFYTPVVFIWITGIVIFRLILTLDIDLSTEEKSRNAKFLFPGILFLFFAVFVFWSLYLQHEAWKSFQPIRIFEAKTNRLILFFVKLIKFYLFELRLPVFSFQFDYSQSLAGVIKNSSKGIP